MTDHCIYYFDSLRGRSGGHLRENTSSNKRSFGGDDERTSRQHDRGRPTIGYVYGPLDAKAGKQPKCSTGVCNAMKLYPQTFFKNHD